MPVGQGPLDGRRLLVGPGALAGPQARRSTTPTLGAIDLPGLTDPLRRQRALRRPRPSTSRRRRSASTTSRSGSGWTPIRLRTRARNRQSGRRRIGQGLELVALAQRLGSAVGVVHPAGTTASRAPAAAGSARGGSSRRSRPGGRGPTRPPACQASSAAAQRGVRVVHARPASTQSATSSGRPGRGARRRGSAAAAARTSPSVSMTTADSSESWVHERRLKLSEPMVVQVSSTMQTFACT